MILAIDPGNVQSGWVLTEDDLSAVIKKGKTDNGELLQILRDLAAGRLPVTHIAIEMIASYGMAVGKSVFDTCVWIGRFCQVCRDMFGIEPQLIYRMEEKMIVCHTSRAKDANIRQALMDRFGEVGTKRDPGYFYGFKSDMWAAMAVAVVLHDKYITDQYVSSI